MSKKYTVNQVFMSLSTYYLEDGRHLAWLHRRRRRAYAPTSNTASHHNHEKINSWVSFTFLYGYGAPLGDPSGRRSSVIIQLFYTVWIPILRSADLYHVILHDTHATKQRPRRHYRGVIAVVKIQHIVIIPWLRLTQSLTIFFVCLVVCLFLFFQCLQFNLIIVYLHLLLVIIGIYLYLFTDDELGKPGAVLKFLVHC